MAMTAIEKSAGKTRGTKKGDTAARGNRSGNASEGKVTRQLRPEEIPIKMQIDEESQKISLLQAELGNINKCISAQNGSTEESKEKLAIKEKLDEIQQQIDLLDGRRSRCLGTLDSKQKELREKSKSVNEMRQSLGYKNELEIERQIQMLEQSMMTSSLTLKEEKHMLAQLQQLRNGKLSLRRAEAAQGAETTDDTIALVKTELDSIRGQMGELRKARRELGKKLYALNENKKKAFDTMKEYFERRNHISDQIHEHILNRQKLVKQLEEINNEYYAKQKLLHQQRLKKQHEEQERRDLQIEIRNLQNQLDNSSFLPYDKEVRLLQQMCIYIDKLRASLTEDDKKLEDSKEEKLIDRADGKIEGVMLAPKSQRDEYLIAPKVKGKERKQRDKPKILKLDMVTISYFESCGVKAPTSIASLGECRTDLMNKMEHFENLRKECDLDEIRGQIEAKLAKAQKKLESLQISSGKAARVAVPTTAGAAP